MGLRTWLAARFASDGDRSPWGSFWFTPVGGHSMGNMHVTADTAMQMSAVFRAVSLVSGHMAMLPVRFYKSGTRQPVKHPLLRLLNTRPNRWQNAFEWREMLQGHLELRGNAYNEIIADRAGAIVELVPRHPDRIKVELLDSGDLRYRLTNPDGSERILGAGQIWHLRGLSSSGHVGMSVIDYARESLGVGLAAQGYGGRFFANDAKPTGGWIEFPGKFADKTARMVFRESLQEAQSAQNRGKMMVLDQGMKYHEVGINNRDAQFLEARKFTINDIARWFGVPPHKLADLDRATFSNIEQQALEYIQDALLPRATRWRSAIDADLLFDDEEIDVEFDFRILMRGDSKQRADYYHNGILDGWLTRNEARDMEGMEPLDGLDEPLRPLNMIEEGDVEEQEIDQEQAEPPAQESAEPADDSGDEASDEKEARFRALVSANAARLSRRIAKSSGPVDPELIAEGLAVPLVAAQAWCAAGVNGILAEDLTASLISLGLRK